MANPTPSEARVAVRGMTCVNCETLVESRFGAVPGIVRVRANHRRGFAEIRHSGALDLERLDQAVADDGYRVAAWDEAAAASTAANTPRDYAEIAGLLAIVAGIVFALRHFQVVPMGLVPSEAMDLGLVFVIGLLASVSSCMAVTGGLLLAVGSAYNELEPGDGRTRFATHLYFNAGRLVSYAVLGGGVGALGAAMTLSETAAGVLTLVASAIMIVLGLQMLRLLPALGGPVLSRALSRHVHRLARGNVAGGAFTLGALTFFLPCGFTQSLQLYVLGKGGFLSGAAIMLVFALGTLPALLSLSFVSSFARGAFQRHFLRLAGAAVLVLALFNIQYGVVLSGIGTARPLDTAGSGGGMRATQLAGRQAIDMRIVDFAYEPSVIEVKVGIPVEWRIDASAAAGCGRVLVSPQLGVRQLLPATGTAVVTFTPGKTGEFPFNCGMGMMTPGSKFVVVPNG